MSILLFSDFSMGKYHCWLTFWKRQKQLFYLLPMINICVVVLGDRDGIPSGMPRFDHLIRYYPLDVISNAMDLANGTMLDIHGGVLRNNMTGPFEVIGTSYTSQLADRRVGDTSEFDVTSKLELTVGFWHYFTASSRNESKVVARIIHKITESNTSKDVSLMLRHGQTMFTFGHRDSVETGATDYGIEEGKWHFIAMTMNGSYVHLHSDTTLLGRYNSTASLAANQPAKVELGYVDNQNDGFACVSVHLAVLIQTEIMALAEACRERSQLILRSTTTVSSDLLPTTSPKTLNNPVMITSEMASSVEDAIKASLEDWIRKLPESEPKLKLTAAEIKSRCDHFDPDREANPPNNGLSNKVMVALEIQRLIGFNSVEEVVSIDANLVTQWKVTTCPWFEEYATRPDLKSSELVLVRSAAEIWHPKMRFLNAASHKGILFLDDQMKISVIASVDIAKPNQTFHFVMSNEGLFETACSLKLDTFPFDTQRCLLSFAMENPLTAVSFEGPPFVSWKEQLETAEWRFVGQRSYIDEAWFLGHSVSVVHFELNLKRNPSYYLSTYYVPTCILGVLGPITFAMPPEFADRPMLVVTTLMAMTVSQSAISSEIPKTSQQNLLSTYLQYMTLLTAVIAVYHLTVCWLGNMDNEGKQRTWKCGGRRLGLLRLVDVVVLIVSFGGFIGLNVPILMALSKA